MAAAICRIEKRNGVDVAFNEDGSVNQVYESALNEGFDNQTALNLYLVSELGSFERVSSEKTLNAVLKYAQEIALPNAQLSDEELFELSNILQKTNQKLSTYVRNVQDPEMHLKIQSFIDQGGELNGVKERATTYENENGDKITTQQIERELIESITDFTNEQAVENAVLALPYTDYVDNYLSSKSAREKLLNRVKEFQRIPSVTVENDQLVKESRRKTILNNTIQVGLSPAGIRSLKRIMRDIASDIWKENQDAVKAVVQDLEQEYVNLGLDIIGLKDTVIDKDSLEVFIDVTEKMLKDPSEQNQQMYLEELEALLPEEFVDPVINTPIEHKGKTLVYFDSNLSKTEIFDKYRLFPVKGNIYHKIDSTLTELDVLETFHNRMINSEVVLPQGYQTVQDPMNIENKPNVMADIRVYLTEYKGRVVSEQNNVIASGVELLMNYKPMVVKSVSNVQTDPEYLKTTFVSDFNKYILQEKLNNSLVYREVLSDFYVGNSDIILKYPIQTIENIKFQKELEDYIRIKRDSAMDYLLPTGLEFATEDVQTLNDPTKVSPFPSQSVREGDYVMTSVSPSMYYRSGNSLYRKVKEDNSVSLYAKLKMVESPIYFDTNTNFNISQTEVNDVFKRLRKLQNSQKTFDFKPSILKNKVNLLNLYSEREQREIDNKTDKCG